MNETTFHKNRLFELLKIETPHDLTILAKQLKLKSSRLKYYNDHQIVPSGEDLNILANYLEMSTIEVQVRLGSLSLELIDWIAHNPHHILDNFHPHQVASPCIVSPAYTTDWGSLYNCDCMDLLQSMPNESVDMVFADPPFNLAKQYGLGIDDSLSEKEYMEWTERWLLECIRVLKPGGSLFVYNIPYWLTHTAHILNQHLNFRHWIAIYMRGLMPVQNKLHPSHYGLLYYVKGEKPKTFNTQRIPMPTCRHCGGEIHDYGGKKSSLNPNGLCIADVWNDINPVRHQKYKNRAANELPLKMMYRIFSLASNKEDVILDPFGGSGTTYVVAEYLKRKWVGSEIGDIECIVDRISQKHDYALLSSIEKCSNVLFTKEQHNLRKKNDFWSYEILDTSDDL